MLYVILIILAFIIVFVLLYNVCLRKYKTPEKKQVSVLTPNPKEEKEKEDLPEILQEVTRGNYMHELSDVDESEELEINMVENKNIKPLKNEFEEIKLEDEMQDEALTTQDRLDELDGDQGQSSIGKQISNMTPEMRAILISNLLPSKYFIDKSLDIILSNTFILFDTQAPLYMDVIM